MTLDMAARISKGTPWSDNPGVKQKRGSVVLLSAEDEPGDTIRPRLDAAGADVTRVVVLKAIRHVGNNGKSAERTFDLSRDLPALEEAIRSEEDCRLVIIDPISAYLGRVDSHNNAETRGLLAPLSELASRHHVAVVAVSHFNKNAGSEAILRMMGSLAFVAAARAAWAVIKDKHNPGRVLFLPIKNNIAPNRGGLAYQIQSLDEHGPPVVVWEPDPVYVSADDAMSAESDGRTEHEKLLELIKDKGGSITARELQDFKRSRYPKSSDATVALNELADCGHGAWEEIVPGPAGGRPTKRFVLGLNTIPQNAIPPVAVS
jgi:hypothetical protein